jgi:hypothetical protein
MPGVCPKICSRLVAKAVLDGGDKVVATARRPEHLGEGGSTPLPGALDSGYEAYTSNSEIWPAVQPVLGTPPWRSDAIGGFELSTQ